VAGRATSRGRARRAHVVAGAETGRRFRRAAQRLLRAVGDGGQKMFQQHALLVRMHTVIHPCDLSLLVNGSFTLAGSRRPFILEFYRYALA